MAETRNPLHDIADLADELTDTRRNIERISDRDPTHRTRHRAVWETRLPSLLDQLAFAVEPGQSYVEESEDTGGAKSFESSPAARLEALAELQRIQTEAARWCTRAGVTLRGTVNANVRALVGAAALMHSSDQKRLCADLQRWRNRAATITGWDRPPVAPRTTCPVCGTRNTIRIRLDKETGICVAPERDDPDQPGAKLPPCGATWDRDTLGLLAEHIRLDAVRTTKDSTKLRAEAVAARRLEDAERARHAQRPDLPDYDTVHARGW